MLKKVRKIVSFIIIVLLITTCALVVNKKTEFKIFGAKEVQANGHTLGSGVYIKVPQTHYVVEAGETIDIEVSVDTTGLSPDVVANAQIIAYPCDWYGYIEILYDGDDPYDNIISVQGVTEGKTAQISIGYYDADGNWIGGDDGEALDAYIEVEVVEPGSSPVTGGTLDMSSYTISTQTDFTQDGTNTMVFNSNLGENVDLTFDIPNPVATGLIVLAPYGDNAEQFQNCVEIVNNDMNIGKNTYSVTLKSLSGGHGIIRGGYVDVTAPPVGNDIQFIGGPFYIDWTIVDNTVHIPIEEICVEEESYTIPLNEQFTINVSFLPNDANEIPSNLNWSITDQSILEFKNETYDSINKVFKGEFIAKKAGTTTVGISIPNTTISDVAEVQVVTFPVSSITMENNYTVNGLNDFTLSATVGNQGIDESTLATQLNWSITDPSVLSLGNSNNLQGKTYTQSFTPLKAGTTTVVATYPGTNISATCEVTVIVDVEMTALVLNQESVETEINSSIDLSASIQPANTTNPPTNLIWTIANENIVVQDSSTTNNSFNKRFNAIGVGQTTITVRTPDYRFQDSVTVNVVGNHISNLYVDKTDLSIEKGKNNTLEVTWNPTNLYPEPTVITSITSTDIASAQVLSTTNQKSIIQVNGLNVGTTTIIIEVQDQSVSCNITVYPEQIEIQAIKLNKTSDTIKVGEGIQLEISLMPENANVLPDEFEWILSNNNLENLALGNESQNELDYTATFRAIKEGTTTITAKVPNTDISASCVVTINPKDIEMTGIAFDKEDSEIEIFDSIIVNASIEPANVTNPPESLIWTVGDTSILEQDSGYTSGNFSKKFNAKKIGATTIKASTLDGLFEKVITVRVVGNSIQDLYIDCEVLPLTLGTDGSLKLTWKPTHIEPTPVPTLSFSEQGIVSTSVQQGNEEATITVTPVKVGRTILTATLQDKQVSCEIVVVKPTIEIESISLDKTTESIKVGESILLTVSVMPTDATEIPEEFDWTLSNDNMEALIVGGLDVDEPIYSVVFKAVKPGKTTITASVPGKNISASCVVTIAPEDVLMTGIEFDVDDEIELEALDTITINASIIPDNTTNPPTSLIWEIGDSTKIINVGQQNSSFTKTFKAVGIGETTITAKTPDGDFSKTISITIIPTKIEGMTINKTQLPIKMGEKGTVRVSWTPAETIPEVVPTISFSEEGIVSETHTKVGNSQYDITLSSIKVGSTTMTVSYQDKQVTCNITVEPIELKSITLDRNIATLKVGARITLSASLFPENATQMPDNLIWSLSNGKMNQINSAPNTGLNDTVTYEAIEAGTTTITVSVPDTTLSDSCEVTIVEDDIDMTGIQLDKHEEEIEVFDSIVINAAILPENATNAPSRLNWTIANTNILEEDSSTANNSFSKKFNAKSLGETKITVSTPDGTFEDEVIINVKGNEIEQFNIDKTNIAITLGDEDSVQVTWNPELVLPIPTVDVAIADENVAIATVESTQSDKCVIKVSPLAVGRTTLTASVGDKEVTCDIVVLAPKVEIQSISLDKKNATIKVGEGIRLTVSITPNNSTELPDRFVWRLSNSKMEQIVIGQNSGELEFSAEFKALQNGITTITVSTPDGKFNDTCMVTIEPADEPIEQLEVDVNNYIETENGNVDYLSSNAATTLAQLLSNIETNGTISVYVKDQLVTNNNQKLPTGTRVEIAKGNQSVSFELVVNGDINGDAEIDDKDLLMLARYNAGFTNEVNFVKGSYLMATNLKNDNVYGDDADLLKLARILVGLE